MNKYILKKGTTIYVNGTMCLLEDDVLVSAPLLGQSEAYPVISYRLAENESNDDLKEPQG